MPETSPQPQPDIAAVPLAGGLVGYSSYDVVRFFERLPARIESGTPALHYIAPRSLLVLRSPDSRHRFVHAGSEEERPITPEGKSSGRCTERCRTTGDLADTRNPRPSMRATTTLAGVKRTQEYIASGDVYSWCCLRSLPGAMSLTHSRRIVHCASSTRRPTCTTVLG